MADNDALELITIKKTSIFPAHSIKFPVPAVQFHIEIADGSDYDYTDEELDASLLQLSSASLGGRLSIEKPATKSPAELFVYLVLGLNHYVGNAIDHYTIESTGGELEYRVSIEYEDHETLLYAAEIAADILNVFMRYKANLDADSEAELRTALNEFVVFSSAKRLDPCSRLLIREGRKLGVPVLNLDQPPFICASEDDIVQHGLIQFGLGVNQKTCKGSCPQGDVPKGSIGKLTDRAQLYALLQSAGIPHPVQDLEFLNRNQIRRAQRSARRIGYPVTIRSRSIQSYAYRFIENSVFGPLVNDSQIALVVSLLRSENQEVWVERYVEGDKYQFLIVEGGIVSVIRSIPPQITGDGQHSIRWLASQQARIKTDPLQYQVWQSMAFGDKEEKCRLELSGLTLDSVLNTGSAMTLRECGTFYNGGVCTSVTDSIPAIFKDLSLKTARILKLSHFVEITIAIADLSKGKKSTNCAVTDISNEPDLQIHNQPSQIGIQPAVEKYFAQMSLTGGTGRIPIISITGTNGKTTTSRMVTSILNHAGYTVGLACTDGVYVNGDVITEGDSSGILGAYKVFIDPMVEVAVLETARGGMVKEGIAFDKCDVGVCLNIAGDHIGYDGINTLDEMAQHKRQVIERTRGTVVLNANDPRCLAMSEYSTAKQIILVAQSAHLAAVVAHSENDGTSVVVDSIENCDWIIIRDQNGMYPLIELNKIPATSGGLALHNIENAMFAVAVALGMGIDRGVVREALSQFGTSIESTPGRLNIYDKLPFKVIIDVAHNPHGIRAFCRYTNKLENTGRKIVLFGPAGHRRNEEIEEVAAAVAGNFDYYICREPFDPSGREQGEVIGISESTLIKKGIHKDKIAKFIHYDDAVKKILSMAKENDLLIIFAGYFYKETWETVKAYCASDQ